MFVDLYNTITGENTHIYIVLEDFTTYNLFKSIIDSLGVIITNIRLIYRENVIEISEHIMCKDVFVDHEYAKIQMFPNMKTNTRFDLDTSGYNYLEIINESKKINDYLEYKEKNIKKLKRFRRKLKIGEMRDNIRFLEFENDINNVDLSKDENIKTRNKMDDILANIKKNKS